MKVSKTGASDKTSKTKTKKRSAGSQEFIKKLEEISEISNTESVVEGGPIGSVAAAFSVQEARDSLEKSSRGLLFDRSLDLLDRLDEIRMGILAGSISKDRLKLLGKKLRERRLNIDDPKLNSIIEEIELRAEVEVAKLSRPHK